MPLQQKRRLNHALFSGIISFIKRGEDKGEIEIKIRGDGSLKRTWEDLKKTRCGRFAHLVPLAPRNTWELEYISLRIPVEIINSSRGGKVFSMHRERLQEVLGLSEGDISRLCDCGLMLPRREMPSRKPEIDYEKLARNYRETMDRMQFVSQSDLAHHLGVSRVWVSRVIKGIKRKVNG